MASRDRSRKDLTLTTLIDLLVQIVFLLAFFIVIYQVVLPPTEPNYKDLWRHLVESIFNRTVIGDPNRETAGAISEVINLRAEVKRLKKELDECNNQRDVCQKALTTCETRCPQASAGPPVCTNGTALLEISVTKFGKINTTASPSSIEELKKIGIENLPLGSALTTDQFEQAFGAIRAAQQKCIYRVNVGCEDRNLPTWQYEAGLQSINTYFSTPRKQRACR